MSTFATSFIDLNSPVKVRVHYIQTNPGPRALYSVTSVKLFRWYIYFLVRIIFYASFYEGRQQCLWPHGRPFIKATLSDSFWVLGYLPVAKLLHWCLCLAGEDSPAGTLFMPSDTGGWDGCNPREWAAVMLCSWNSRLGFFLPPPLFSCVP